MCFFESELHFCRFFFYPRFSSIPLDPIGRLGDSGLNPDEAGDFARLKIQEKKHREIAYPVVSLPISNHLIWLHRDCIEGFSARHEVGIRWIKIRGAR